MEWQEAQQAGTNDFEKPSVSFFSLGKRFTKPRREVDWLDQYSFKITRYALKYQADAWRAAFVNGRGFPRFHSRHGRDPSFTVPEKVMIRDGRLYLPCIGWLPIRRRGGNPHPYGVPVRAVVKKQAGKWHVSVCCQYLLKNKPLCRFKNVPLPAKKTGCQKWHATVTTGLNIYHYQRLSVTSRLFLQVFQSRRIGMDFSCNKRNPCLLYGAPE
ncbi:MAG: hypothetical protein F4223_10375 [Rhodobacteraceae bacterium]|nr:hypothetical protein [Paracoccaceae bacterium]